MNKVTVEIIDAGEMRPSEIIADLRSVSETLYYPMKLVGFQDHRQRLHLCPHEERQSPCLHKLPACDPQHVDYEDHLQRERHANLRLDFPHAGISIYLS